MSGITTYHGTAGENIFSILKEGLKAQKPDGRFDEGVYFTQDIEKAARYAVEGTGSHNPVVLEVWISGPKRVRKIYRDPLDRDEDHLYDDVSEDAYSQALYDFESDIEKVLQVSSIPREVGLNNLNDIDSLKGVNIYKLLLDYARSRGMDIREFKKRLFHEMGPGMDYDGWFEIADDGTIIPTEAYFESLHQQIYPKNVPPQAIKSVWVGNVHPDEFSGETLEIKSKLLPQETRSIYEDIRRLVQDYSWEDSLDQTEMDAVVDNFRDADTYSWYEDIWSDLQNYANSGDYEKFKNSLYIVEEAINEDWFNDQYGKSTIFTKMSPQQAATYLLGK
jgi:hypothetical protein